MRFIILIVLLISLYNLRGQPLLLSGSSTPASCYGSNDGTATVIASGGTGFYIYTWSHDSSLVTATAIGLSAGIYIVTVTDAVDTATVNIIVSEPDDIVIGANVLDAGCGNPNGQININTSFPNASSLIYYWSHDVSLHTTYAINLTHGLYTVFASDGICNSNILNITIDSIPGPTIDVYDTLTILLGESITIYNTFTPSEHIALSWYPTEGLSCTNCVYPVATPEESAVYYCEIYDSTSRCTAYDSVIITVKVPTYYAVVPNTFTPNNDYINDRFYVRGYGIAKIHLFIYDRFGAKVFETQNLDIGWDGLFQGQPQNTDIYAYYIKVTYVDSSEKILKGTLTLLR